MIPTHVLEEGLALLGELWDVSYASDTQTLRLLRIETPAHAAWSMDFQGPNCWKDALAWTLQRIDDHEASLAQWRLRAAMGLAAPETINTTSG